mgnify:CR=1 FL=1
MFGAMQDNGARMPMIAGNWKMNKTTVEAVTLSQQISFESDKAWEAVEVVICPPFTDLKSVFNVLAFDHSSIKLGAQDVYWEPDGAYTGAISVSMLKELTCEYCIVGHSERREYFGETDETVNRKIKALLAQGLHPIMCCGEMRAIRWPSSASKYDLAGRALAKRTSPSRSSPTSPSGQSVRAVLPRLSRRRRHARTFVASLPTLRVRTRRARCAFSMVAR